MKRKFLNPLMLLVLISTLWGCYPGGPDYYSEYDLVYTNYDQEYVFTGRPTHTYAMPTKIVLITSTTQTVPQFVSPQYAAIINSTIQKNMSSLGYQLIADSSQADYILLTGALEVENLSYSYWDSYYGWYYPGGWYGSYYPYPVVTSYTTGTLAMTLLDRNNLSPTNQTRAVWVGLINGLLEGTSTDWSNRITKSINQAYSQSPYLHQ